MTRLKPAWISAALSILSLVVVVVTAAVLLSRPADTPAAYTDDPGPASQSEGPDEPEQKYTFAKVGNSCDVLDLAAVQQRGGKTLTDQTHFEIKTDVTGSLSCQAIYDSASITFQASLGHDRVLFELEKEETNTTGSGRRTGTAPEFGNDTYFILVESISTVFDIQNTSATVDLGILDANLHATVHLQVSRRDGPLTGDEVLQLAKDQMKHILEQLDA